MPQKDARQCCELRDLHTGMQKHTLEEERVPGKDGEQ